MYENVDFSLLTGILNHHLGDAFSAFILRSEAEKREREREREREKKRERERIYLKWKCREEPADSDSR